MFVNVMCAAIIATLDSNEFGSRETFVQGLEEQRIKAPTPTINVELMFFMAFVVS